MPFDNCSGSIFRVQILPKSVLPFILIPRKNILPVLGVWLADSFQMMDEMSLYIRSRFFMFGVQIMLKSNSPLIFSEVGTMYFQFMAENWRNIVRRCLKRIYFFTSHKGQKTITVFIPALYVRSSTTSTHL